MRSGFPAVVVRFLVFAFAVSLLGLSSWLAYFVLRGPAVVLAQVGAAGGLWLTAGLSACVALTSGLLASHHKFEGYARGEEVLFRTCLILSTGVLLCSGLWASAIALFA